MCKDVQENKINQMKFYKKIDQFIEQLVSIFNTF